MSSEQAAATPESAPAPPEPAKEPVMETTLPPSERSQVSQAYDFTHPHSTLKAGMDGTMKVIDYEPLKFSSFSVFTAHAATIFENPILGVEQVMITIIFVIAATPSFIMFNHKAAENRHGPITVNEWLDSQEDKMRQFAMIMTTLAAFLLTFYTAIAVGRWWTIRTQGVGGIKAAAVELELYICQFVTQEERILSAIRRYARASLILITLWRRDQVSHAKQQLCEVDPPILEEDEIDLLTNLDHHHCLHETIWSWQGAIVSMLYREGKIKSEPLLCFLLDRVSVGRTAVQCIHTHLAVRVPFPYVHLLGFLVKLHNTVLAIIMGILFGAAVRDGRTIICVQLFGRTLLLPFLFNAILLINAELSDPFDGGVAAFPCSVYQNALNTDCKKLVEATNLQPEWMKSAAKA